MYVHFIALHTPLLMAGRQTSGCIYPNAEIKLNKNMNWNKAERKELKKCVSWAAEWDFLAWLTQSAADSAASDELTTQWKQPQQPPATLSIDTNAICCWAPLIHRTLDAPSIPDPIIHTPATPLIHLLSPNEFEDDSENTVLSYTHLCASNSMKFSLGLNEIVIPLMMLMMK